MRSLAHLRLLFLLLLSCQPESSTTEQAAPAATVTDVDGDPVQIGCTRARDCYDADPCTHDVCRAKICWHDPIAGCSAFGDHPLRGAGP